MLTLQNDVQWLCRLQIVFTVKALSHRLCSPQQDTPHTAIVF